MTVSAIYVAIDADFPIATAGFEVIAHPVASDFNALVAVVHASVPPVLVAGWVSGQNQVELGVFRTVALVAP